jgi:hypothetical protein
MITPPPKTLSKPLDCAVVYAGQESVLLIEERAGRLPLRAVSPGGGAWMCADGQWEHLDIQSSSGEQGWRDLATIAVVAATKGVLVAELPAGGLDSVSSSDFVSQWIMRAHVPKSVAFVEDRDVLLEQIQIASSIPQLSSAYEPSSREGAHARMLGFKQAAAASKVTMRIYDESQNPEKFETSVDRGLRAPAFAQNPASSAWGLPSGARSVVGADLLKSGRSSWATWSKFARNAVLFVAAVCLVNGALKVKDYFSDKPQPQKQSVEWKKVAEKKAEPTQTAQAPVLSAIEEQSQLSDEKRAMEEIRRKLNYVHVSYQGRAVMVLDAPSKVLLTQQAAQANDLNQEGLSWKDLYGVIHAETAWVSRDGMGKNGVVSVGLAQMEPATAKSLGINDSNDDVEAVFGAARLLKEAAAWSKNKVAKLRLPKKEAHQKLREGVSIYYNLSTAARRTWDGRNTHEMPIETSHHIKNTRDGANYAGQLEAKFRSMDLAQSLNLQAAQKQPSQGADEFTPRRRYESTY